MNEHKDQSTWFEVQTRRAYGRWVYAGDDSCDMTADTREEAEAIARRVIINPNVSHRVVKRSGLARAMRGDGS